jgi:hypothetical protein
MKKMISAAVAFAIGAVLVVPVFAQAPTYSVSWIAGPPGQEQTYTGTTTLSVDGKGMVSGKMALTAPATVTAALSGQVTKNVWTFEFPFEIPDQMCSGTIKGTGKVAEGRKTVEGSAVISGACAPEPFNSTFTMTLREKSEH